MTGCDWVSLGEVRVLHPDDTVAMLMGRLELGEGSYLTPHGTMQLLEPSKMVSDYEASPSR